MNNMEFIYTIATMASQNVRIRGINIHVTPDLIHCLIYKGTQKEIGEVISSKGIDRLISLEKFLSGINCKTNKPISWFHDVNIKYRVTLTACYIINAQVFSDGNHRTALQYLENSGLFDEGISIKLIDQIKSARYKIITDFQNTTSNGHYISFEHFIENMNELYKDILIPYL